MKYRGVTVFILFFGASLLEAFRDQEWARAALWLGAGCAFWTLDHFAIRRRTREP